MKRHISRNAVLCAGASAIAMAVAMPAVAQAVVNPGMDVDPVFAVTADQVLVQGVTDAGTPAATAVVNSTATGVIVQRLTIEETPAIAPLAAPSLAAPPVGPDAVISFSNAGSVSIKALATATNEDGHAVANATLSDAVSQIVNAPNVSVSASMVNTGVFDLGATASATGTDFPGDIAARAQTTAVGGLHQEATVEGGAGGAATTSIANSGSILFNGAATANSAGDALARVTTGEAVFMRSQSNGGGAGVATTTFTNSGILTAGSTASATSSAGAATADSTLGGGEHGLLHFRTAANGGGDDSSTVSFANSAAGRITATSVANATGVTDVSSSASASSILVTKAQGNGQDGGLSVASASNAGRIDIGAASTASASGEGGLADAQATIEAAVQQVAEAEGSPQIENRVASVSFSNDSTGRVNITATASATGSGASAVSLVDPGFLQQATTTGDASATFSNGGVVVVSSTANATGLLGSAEATAVGLEQEVTGNTAQASFTNSGTFTVLSTARVSGEDSGSAVAGAIGYTAFGDPLNLSVSNSGAFTVTADADPLGPATASALGLGFYGTYDPTAVTPGEEGGGHGGTEGHGGPLDGGHGAGAGGPVVWTDEAANSIAGSIVNSGSLNVTANAAGAIPVDQNAQPVKLAIAPAELSLGATAVGVDFESAVNTATFTNTGSITVSARTNVGSASATGILVRDFVASPIVAPDGSVFTIVNNGGSITARESLDGGQTWQHGLAIDTTQAPNAVAIRFLGASSVYGDIDLSADDSITIAGGTTRLDGLINPNGELEGSLTIGAGATLQLMDPRLANPSYNGPAGGYVNSFTLASGGTLSLDLNLSSGGSNAISSLAAPPPIQVVAANTVTLSGTLLLNLSTPNGLYADVYNLDNIIDANTLNGTFSSVRTSTGTPLLVPVAVYDSGANVDLTITRVGFGATAGLTGNQRAVGNGIEAVYDPAATGPFAAMQANLFLLDATDYPLALEQLTGAQTAGYLQSLRNLSQQLNGMIAAQSDCLTRGGAIEACREPDAGFRLWALGGQGNANVDADANAPGSDAQQSFALVGVDYLTGHATFGGYLGYRDLEVDFDRQRGRVEADGWVLGARASYDTGDFYVRGNVSYTTLNGSSVRTIGILSTAGVAAGKPDTKSIALYGEAGRRFAVRGTWLTPFVALDYADIELDSFTESGVPGANLAYDSQSNSQASLLAGVKWTGQMGPLVPEAYVAYRADLGDSTFDVTSRFADAPAGSDFTVRSPDADEGSFLAGLSLGGGFSDRVKGRIGYAGRFGDGVDDQAFYGSVTITFGGGR